MSSSQYKIRYTTGRKRGRIVLPMFLQTGWPLYATLGGCTTAGAYTHTISLATSQTPISLAFHFEKELTGQDVRYDLLGFMPDYWKLTCGDDASRWKARQEFAANFAYTRASGGDLAEPAKNTLSLYEWNDLKHASGALTMKYNGTDLEFTPRAFDLTVTRTKPLWGVKGASGYPTEAFVSGVGIEWNVEGYLTGDNVRTLMATKPEDYVSTYVDGSILFYKSATRTFPITLSNIYLIPDETILNEVDWYERKTLRFVSWSATTSIGSVPIDNLDKTYYEND